MKLAMIVAMAKNGVIGKNNQLPWHLPNDLKFFKASTMGKPIIMGRKTFESIGRPLPGRTNIVMTRDSGFVQEGVRVVRSAEEALELAKNIAAKADLDEVMIIGGSQLYEQLLSQAERLYITQVHAEVEGDAYFPELDFQLWREESREDHQATDTNPYDYSFVTYSRKH